jgi:7-cyano-7-deazaguanine synthase in queuosine biosynthesis
LEAKQSEKNVISFFFEVKQKTGSEMKQKEKLLKAKQIEKTLISFRFEVKQINWELNEAKRKIIGSETKRKNAFFHCALVESEKKRNKNFFWRNRRTLTKAVYY